MHMHMHAEMQEMQLRCTVPARAVKPTYMFQWLAEIPDIFRRWLVKMQRPQRAESVSTAA